ncbi:MAG: hypothetical protein AAF493_13345 [Pseudomonadota bacterium]
MREIDAAQSAVRAYIDGFNARDAEQMANAFNFPHVRLAKGLFTHIESAAIFIERQDTVTELLRDEGWHHTRIESMTAVHSGPDKVHLAIEFTRRQADASVYSRFNTLWIVTDQNNHWGVQFRSSFLLSDASTLGPVSER